MRTTARSGRRAWDRHRRPSFRRTVAPGSGVHALSAKAVRPVPAATRQRPRAARRPGHPAARHIRHVRQIRASRPGRPTERLPPARRSLRDHGHPRARTAMPARLLSMGTRLSAIAGTEHAGQPGGRRSAQPSDAHAAAASGRAAAASAGPCRRSDARARICHAGTCQSDST